MGGTEFSGFHGLSPRPNLEKALFRLRGGAEESESEEEEEITACRNGIGSIQKYILCLIGVGVATTLQI